MPTSLQSVGGAVQLALDLAGGLLRTVEKVHAGAARHTPGAAAGISGQIYSLLHGIQSALGGAVAGGVRSIGAVSPDTTEAPHSIVPVAILNGICGDHLDATQNPLAIPMGLRTLEGPIDWARSSIDSPHTRVSSRVAVWVHGLCLSEQNWIRRQHPPMGVRLREDLDITSIYVRYNTGRRISINGRELSRHLERLIDAWPVPIESIALIGHSMGGLVIRSAGYYGDRDGCAWRKKLRNVVCLATPHHGAPLERIGHATTLAMQASPYLTSFAFGGTRSAGIKDLRYGNLLDEDWQGVDADRGDNRTPVPLLPDVDHYFAAASLGHHRTDPTGHILGDLLVPIASALGTHKDPRKRVDIAAENCCVFPGMNHFDLLGHPEVCQQLVHWLTADGR